MMQIMQDNQTRGAQINTINDLNLLNNFVYNMAALGVGGGLVLNMANNKGQQSNAQLYGQY